jgi:hypothetical protein
MGRRSDLDCEYSNGSDSSICDCRGCAQSKKSRDREKRSQAESISAWIKEGGVSKANIAILNNSNEPIFKAVISLVTYQGAGPQSGKNNSYQTLVGIVPPGMLTKTIPHGGAGMMMRFGLEIAFTDKAGAHWIRTVDGKLKSIPKAAADYYEIPPPQDWQ